MKSADQGLRGWFGCQRRAFGLLHAVSRSSRCLVIAILASLFAVACAHDAGSAAAAGESRKAAHEPFSDPNADALLCDLSMRSASGKVTTALKQAGLTNVGEAAAGVAPTYFLHRDPNANLAKYDLAHARSYRADYAPSNPHRALRAEILPIAGKDCFSVKFWEDCAPDTAPMGAPHEWHWCGDPTSATFINRVQALRPLLGATAGAIEPD